MSGRVDAVGPDEMLESVAKGHRPMGQAEAVSGQRHGLVQIGDRGPPTLEPPETRVTRTDGGRDATRRLNCLLVSRFVC